MVPEGRRNNFVDKQETFRAGKVLPLGLLFPVSAGVSRPDADAHSWHRERTGNPRVQCPCKGKVLVLHKTHLTKQRPSFLAANSSVHDT